MFFPCHEIRFAMKSNCAIDHFQFTERHSQLEYAFQNSKSYISWYENARDETYRPATGELRAKEGCKRDSYIVLE